MNETIKCPNCDELFELSEAISYDIEKRIKKKHEIEIEEKRKAFEEKAKKDAYESVILELSDLREQLEEKTRNLKEARKQELELLKKQRELQEKEENMELEVTRKLDEERQKILEKATGKFEEEHRLKDAEKDKKLNDMKKQIDELKRKSEQGSQQTQGEVLELDLENILKKSFTHDNIEPVPKGIKGADVLHKVHSPSGQFCGTIVWEKGSFVEQLCGKQNAQRHGVING